MVAAKRHQLFPQGMSEYRPILDSLVMPSYCPYFCLYLDSFRIQEEQERLSDPLVSPKVVHITGHEICGWLWVGSSDIGESSENNFLEEGGRAKQKYP